jgi:hypothetical protein
MAILSAEMTVSGSVESPLEGTGRLRMPSVLCCRPDCDIAVLTATIGAKKNGVKPADVTSLKKRKMVGRG